MATISRANLYHVPLKKWNKWPPNAREIFNYLYSLMRANQKHFAHTDAPPVTRPHWDVTAWNTAWAAADHRMNAERVKVTH
jgi:hypothetical protein